jgi:hypothetical protein
MISYMARNQLLGVVSSSKENGPVNLVCQPTPRVRFRALPDMF